MNSISENRYKTDVLNEIIELETQQMSFGSAAIGRLKLPDQDYPLVVFVEGAAPQERIQAKVIKKYKNYWQASVIKIISPSPLRVKPPCPVFGQCGGCQWQHLDYEAQIQAKKEILLHQLSKVVKIPTKTLETKLQVHAAKNQLGYRSRIQVRGDQKGLGFFKKRSHSIAYTDKCLVAHFDIQKAWSYFSDTHSLESLSKATGQFKVEWTRTSTGQVFEAINREHAAFGFTQTNEEQNKVLVEIVTKQARSIASKKLLLDLYAGDGNLSQNLMNDFKSILCVDAFNDGIDPSQIQHTDQTQRVFIRAKVEVFLRDKYWMDAHINPPDCIILDPPRNGLEEVARLILELKTPQIILVSCDPTTLARDLTVLSSRYTIDQIHLIDMFPQTYHMETVVSLVR